MSTRTVELLCPDCDHSETVAWKDIDKREFSHAFGEAQCPGEMVVVVWQD